MIQVSHVELDTRAPNSAHKEPYATANLAIRADTITCTIKDLEDGDVTLPPLSLADFWHVVSQLKEVHALALAADSRWCAASDVLNDKPRQ
jgi:hypothetical protein